MSQEGHSSCRSVPWLQQIPPVTAGMPQAGMGTVAAVMKLCHTAATAAFLAAMKHSSGCQNLLQRGCTQILRLARFHPDCRACLAAETLGEESRRQKRRKEGILAEQTCLRAQSLLGTITAQVKILHRCSTGAGGLHCRRKRDKEGRKKEMPRTASPVVTL